MANNITVSSDGNNIDVSVPSSGLSAINSLQAFSGLGTDANPLDFSAFKVITQPSDLLLYGTYSAGVYTLPTADLYYFTGPQDYGTDEIVCGEVGGTYVFYGGNYSQLTSTTTGNFISSSTAGTSIKIIDMFITVANGTAISMSGGFNSCILEFAVFINCKKCVDLDTGSFFTNEVLVMVVCEDGCVVKDVGTMSGRLIQWSVGQDLGGVALTLKGAASERFFLSQADSRPTATESYLDIQADYGGLSDIGLGVHTGGAGDFFKVGTRDQTDKDINVSDVVNVTNSHSTVACYIALGDEAQTSITDGVETVIAGTYTAEIANRFTVAGGKTTYTGNETDNFDLVLKCLCSNASGNNKNYELYYRLNGTTLIPITLDQVNCDAGTPAKAVCVGSVELSTGDYLEPIIIGIGTANNNVTCSALAMIIG